MAEDSLITDTIHQEEVTARKTGDSNLARFTGQDTSSNGPVYQTPDYSDVFGSLIDLVDNEDLLTAIARLDRDKNSKISISGGGSNPKSFNFRHRINAVWNGGDVIIDVNEKVGWDNSYNNSRHARNSSGAFPDDTFITDVWVIRGTAGAIGAQFTVIKEIGIRARKARLDP